MLYMHYIFFPLSNLENVTKLSSFVGVKIFKRKTPGEHKNPAEFSLKPNIP